MADRGQARLSDVQGPQWKGKCRRRQETKQLRPVHPWNCRGTLRCRERCLLKRGRSKKEGQRDVSGCHRGQGGHVMSRRQSSSVRHTASVALVVPCRFRFCSAARAAFCHEVLGSDCCPPLSHRTSSVFRWLRLWLRDLVMLVSLSGPSPASNALSQASA